jgi:tetratricopeptide (TPR) repeat protein
MRLPLKVILLILAGLWLLTHPAGAQPSAPSRAELAQAERLFAEAEAYYNLQKYEQALKAYEDAYLLSRKPELLFNIGQCYRYLDQLEEARRSYQAYLRQLPEQDPNRAIVTRLLKEIEETLAKQKGTKTAEPTGTISASAPSELSPLQTQPVLAPAAPTTTATRTQPEAPRSEAEKAGLPCSPRALCGVAVGSAAVGVSLLGAGGIVLLKARSLSPFGEEGQQREALGRRSGELVTLGAIALTTALVAGVTGVVLYKIQAPKSSH